MPTGNLDTRFVEPWPPSGPEPHDDSPPLPDSVVENIDAAGRNSEKELNLRLAIAKSLEVSKVEEAKRRELRRELTEIRKEGNTLRKEAGLINRVRDETHRELGGSV